MWQQKENLFSGGIVLHTWLKRATSYRHFGLLEQNAHMVWRRFASGLANQGRRQHCWPCLITHLTCRIQSLHSATKVNPCEAHKRVKRSISKTDLGGKTQCGHWDTLLESASSSSDLFKDFFTWQSCKLTEGNLLDSGHFLLLTLLLAEMQWWIRTLTKELIYVFMIVALNSCLEYWCQAHSYQQRTHTELKKWNTTSNIK